MKKFIKEYILHICVVLLVAIVVALSTLMITLKEPDGVYTTEEYEMTVAKQIIKYDLTKKYRAENITWLDIDTLEDDLYIFTCLVQIKSSNITTLCQCKLLVKITNIDGDIDVKTQWIYHE